MAKTTGLKKEKKPGRIKTWWANRKAKAAAKKKAKADAKAAKKGTPIGDDATDGDGAAVFEEEVIAGAKASADATIAAGPDAEATAPKSVVPIAGYLQRRLALAAWAREKADELLGTKNFLDKKVRGPLVVAFLGKVEKGPGGNALTRDEQEYVCDVFAEYLSVVLVAKAMLRGDVKNRVKSWISEGTAGKDSVEIPAPKNGAAAPKAKPSTPNSASSSNPAARAASAGSTAKSTKASSPASTAVPQSVTTPAAPAPAKPPEAAPAPAVDDDIPFELDDDDSDDATKVADDDGELTGDLTEPLAEVRAATTSANDNGDDGFGALLDEELGLAPINDDKEKKAGTKK